MSEHILHAFPGMTSAAVTKGYFGKFDTSNKIALCTTAGERADGVIGRSTGSGDASSLKVGVCEMIASAAITAGDFLSPATSGKARSVIAGDERSARALTAASTDGDTILALVFGPEGPSNEVDAVAAVTADGAVAVPLTSKSFFITKAGVAAMTLVDPTSGTHDGLILRFVAATANAHTLSNAAGSGFNAGGASKDVATYGGAIGDNIIIAAYGGKWHVLSSVNITLG